MSDKQSLDEHFASARDYRNSFAGKNNTYSTRFELLVDTAEMASIIANVASVLSLNDISIKSIGVMSNREYANGILRIVLDSQEAKDKAALLLKQMNYIVYDK
jgi:prephenate dehydrogenase